MVVDTESIIEGSMLAFLASAVDFLMIIVLMLAFVASESLIVSILHFFQEK
jgi:hypothetical protein